MIKIITIEECIEVLSGTHSSIAFNGDINYSDKKIMYSLARQTVSGTPYTDRQYELAKLKVTSYKKLLEEIEIDVDSSIDILRMPLRQIDRDRWVRVVEIKEQLYVAVRFTFNKKLISAMELLSSIESKQLYDKHDKIHYFNFSEINLYNIITVLKDKNFIIQSELQEKYNLLEMMNKNKNSYIPGIYNLKLQNLHAKAIDYMISSIGEPSIDNLAIYKDRNLMFGIKHFDEVDLNNSVSKLTTLSQKIVNRTHQHILVNSDEYTFDRLAESILELNRYPILIILNDKTDFINLQKVHYSFRNIFSNSEFCTLYRKENDIAENIEFNQYIKDNHLNNLLAINSKIVYTTTNKLVKTMIKSDWRPQSAILMGSVRSTKIDAYLQEMDLIIHYDTDISPFRKYEAPVVPSFLYNTPQTVEKI